MKEQPDHANTRSLCLQDGAFDSAIRDPPAHVREDRVLLPPPRHLLSPSVLLRLYAFASQTQGVAGPCTLGLPAVLMPSTSRVGPRRGVVDQRVDLADDVIHRASYEVGEAPHSLGGCTGSRHDAFTYTAPAIGRLCHLHQDRATRRRSRTRRLFVGSGLVRQARFFRSNHALRRRRGAIGGCGRRCRYIFRDTRHDVRRCRLFSTNQSR